MKKNYFLVVVFTIMSLNLIFAQSKSLKGTWLLESAEIANIADPSKVLSNESSFFSYYVNQVNKLEISDKTFPVNVGGETINYSYSLSGDKLTLEANNTIFIKSNSEDAETINKKGSTVFNFKLRNKKLTIYRNNHSFKEQYIFKLVK